MSKNSKCYVPGCCTGYKSNDSSAKVSTFGPPASMLEAWSRAIPRADRPITNRDRVCELHFAPHFIIRNFEMLVDGKVVTVPRERPALHPDAIPTVFPNVPGYLSKHVKPPRRVIKKVASEKVCVKTLMSSVQEPVVAADYMSAVNCSKEITFEDVVQMRTLLCPDGWTSQASDTTVCFGKTVIDKGVLKILVCVSVYNSNHIAVFHRGRQVVYDGIPELFLTTDECLIRFFEDLNARTECRGSTGVGKEDFSKCMPKSRTAFFDDTLQTWRHLKCTGFVKTGLVCAACKKFRRVLQTCLRKKKPKKPLQIAAGSRYWYLQRRKMRLCQQQRNSLRVILATMKRKLRRQTENGFGSFLEKLPDNQKVSFEHAVRLAKAKSKRGMRYDHKCLVH
jgi:hypothetical protein